MDEVGRTELDAEGWYDIGEEDNSFRDIGSDKVECSGEDDHVKDVID